MTAVDDTVGPYAPSPLGGEWHRHGTSEPGWIEHSHLRGTFAHGHDPSTGFQTPPTPDLAANLRESLRRLRTAPMPDPREPLGQVVRDTWVDWAKGQPDPKPSWLVGWDDLDDGQREVDMRIGQAVAKTATAEADGEYRHASLIIACLVRRLGGHVTIDPAELADEPAAMATVGTSGGFEIKVIEPDPPGPSLVDMGALSLGYVERSPTMLGGSLNPSPDCGGPRKPPAATELWWCDTHTQFHKPRSTS